VPVKTSGHLQLFRSEALAERQTPWLGPVLLAPRVSHYVFALIAVLAIAALLALLFLAGYTRKATLNGWLVAEQGVVRIVAPRAGLVTAVRVSEGTAVHKGDALLTLSDEEQSSTLGATQARISRVLGERRKGLLDERIRQQALQAQQAKALAGRVSTLHTEQAQVQGEVELLRARLALAERTETQHRQMEARGLESAAQLQQVQADTLEQRARLAALERTALDVDRALGDADAQLRELPFESEKEIARLDREIAILEQDHAEAEARREIVLVAPQSGTATAIQARPGATATPATPLLSIVPEDLRLEAHLYSPSRAVGFVQPGQRVLLRYAAFPFQKFGHQEGAVVSVSRAAVSPGELSSEVAGLTSVVGAADRAGAEPVYRITVRLASQSVTAYGRQVALQPGMLLEADVELERRRIYEWILEPLYTLTGR
jgi:membrane fusion protein